MLSGVKIAVNSKDNFIHIMDHMEVLPLPSSEKEFGVGKGRGGGGY